MQAIKHLTPEEAVNILRSGRFFSCVFIKRTTGETRKLQGRTGVKKYLKGGGARYSFSSHNLIPVYDLQAKGYRAIPVEAILTVNQRPVVQHA